MHLKRTATLALLLFFAAVIPARADNVVKVDFAPVTSGILGETVAANFLWDTTTNTASDVNIIATGPFGTFSNTPTIQFGTGFGSQPAGITIFSVVSPGGTVVLDDIFASGFAPVAPIPGIYNGQYYFLCSATNIACQNAPQETGGETIDVTATPEPSAALLLGAGLLGLMLFRLKS
jgi:hypothetical protein